jgi:hypothetical protein
MLLPTRINNQTLIGYYFRMYFFKFICDVRGSLIVSKIYTCDKKKKKKKGSAVSRTRKNVNQNKNGLIIELEHTALEDTCLKQVSKLYNIYSC